MNILVYGFELCPQLQRIMREWGEKTQNWHGWIYQGYYHLLCFKTEGKYIKSVIFVLFHDFIKQAQGYSLLHLEANKNPYLSELMFFQENEEKWI